MDAEDADSWIMKFEKYSAYRGFADRERLSLMAVLLRDEASDWYDSLEDDIKRGWLTLKQAFEQRFQHSELTRWRKTNDLWQRVQGVNENVDSYITSVKKLAKVVGVEGEQLRYALQRGLRPQILAHVIQTQATTVDDLVKAARVAEKQLIRSPLKQAAIGQALVQAIRPYGCLMPLLFAVGVDADQCGDKSLHVKLSRLGFSLSSDEIQRYKHSVMQSLGGSDDVSDFSSQSATTTATSPSPVTHFVADNVDHNIRTLDGYNTFHGMGIIAATVCPSGGFDHRKRAVSRIAQKTKASDAIHGKSIPIVNLRTGNATGIRDIGLREIQSIRSEVQAPVFNKLNALWQTCGLVSPRMSPRPNWSGFMQAMFDGLHADVAKIEMLSIIDLSPTDETCIYSTLSYIVDQSQKLGVPTPNITFDQPLYMKAVDIVCKAKMNVVVRLGGFHTLMNFLGSIGYLMKGSGLDEVLGLIYGPNTVVQLMNGKAYARAVHGHFLVHSVLNDILLTYLKSSENAFSDECPVAVTVPDDDVCQLKGALSADVISDVEALYEQISANKLCASEYTLLHDDSLCRVETLVADLRNRLSSCSRTSQLWLLYMRCVELVKMFLFAERTGNWLMHVHAVSDMLGIFAATGHANYAKAARLYVQQMHSLQKTHPQLHNQFVNGYHTVRRSDRCWAGLSLDLVIEQTMMRAVKSKGGLTSGRGLHETVRLTWVNTLSSCASIRAALTQVTGFKRNAVDHAEAGVSRMRRDLMDMETMKRHLTVYSPFRFLDAEQLLTLSSGVAAGPKDNVNCDTADVIGLE